MRAEVMRRRYFAEAAVAIAAARLAIRFCPRSWVFGWARRTPGRIQRFRVEDIEWVSWAIDTWASRPRRRGLCLPLAIAAQSMLRRRGIASCLCLGVARRDGRLVSHAWIEIGRDIVVGGPEARGFTKIAEFGSEGA